MSFKKLSIIIVSTLMLGAIFLPLAPVAAQTNQAAVCDGLALTGGQCGAEQPGQTGVNSTIKLVINLMSLAVGVVSVVMIIIGGFKYITSQGESSNTASAKNTILYALIGLVIVAMAQIIVKFVLNRLK